MSSTSDRTGVSRLLSSEGSLLERVRPESQNDKPLSEIQSQVDTLVTQSVDQATDAKTLIAMVAGGFASRFARMGTLAAASPVLTRGQTIFPLLVRGGSYAVALGAESFAFAGVNRQLNRLEGQQTTRPFTQEWGHAALTLGALKSFGGLTQDQNIILQHLAADLGLVAGQNLGYAAHLGSKPQGDFIAQMLGAEAMNWQMKGGMSLVHGLAPSLLPTEKSMDLYLKSQEMGLQRLSPLFAQLAAEGGPGGFMADSVKSEEAEKHQISAMSKEGEGGSEPERPHGYRSSSDWGFTPQKMEALKSLASRDKKAALLLRAVEMGEAGELKGELALDLSENNIETFFAKVARKVPGTENVKIDNNDYFILDLLISLIAGGKDVKEYEEEVLNYQREIKQLAQKGDLSASFCLLIFEKIKSGEITQSTSESLISDISQMPGAENIETSEDLFSLVPIIEVITPAKAFKLRLTLYEGNPEDVNNAIIYLEGLAKKGHERAAEILRDYKNYRKSVLDLGGGGWIGRAQLSEIYREHPKLKAAVEKTPLSTKETRKLLGFLQEKAVRGFPLALIQLPEFLGWMTDAGFSSDQILQLAQPFAEKGLSHFQYHGLPRFLDVAKKAGLNVDQTFELTLRLAKQDFGYDVLHFNQAAKEIEEKAKAQGKSEVEKVHDGSEPEAQVTQDLSPSNLYDQVKNGDSHALDLLSEMARDHLGAYFALEKLVSEGHEGARKAFSEAKQNLSASSVILLQVARQNEFNALMAFHGMRLMGNKDLEDLKAKMKPVPGTDKVRIPFNGPFPDSPLTLMEDGSLTMTKDGRQITFTPEGKLHIGTMTPTPPFQWVPITSKDLMELKTAIENELKSKPEDHRLKQIYQRLLEKFSD